MERNRLILLMLLGAIIVIVGAITYQWLLMLIAISFIALIIIVSGIKHWFESRS
ncbi:MAG: hypothetical protein QMC96_05445 [Methanomicrobiales archaeon]|nr:hypothetical protein [Methanomicrobiales archaeon]